MNSSGLLTTKRLAVIGFVIAILAIGGFRFAVLSVAPAGCSSLGLGASSPFATWPRLTFASSPSSCIRQFRIPAVSRTRRTRSRTVQKPEVVESLIGVGLSREL